MRPIHFIAMAIMILSCCCGCAAPVDKYGNEQQPALARSAIMYEPVTHYTAASAAALKTWCSTNNGKLSRNGDGCAVEWNKLFTLHGWPCTEATVIGLSPGRAASAKTFMDAVCNGWVP